MNSRLLGHVIVQTTARYAHLTRDSTNTDTVLIGVEY